MNQDTTKGLKPNTEPKSGFFKRILTKMDTAMKAKADAQESTCCSSDAKGKGGKCC